MIHKGTIHKTSGSHRVFQAANQLPVLLFRPVIYKRVIFDYPNAIFFSPVDKSVSDSLTINYLADYADAIKYFERFMMVEMIHPIDTIFSEETIVSEKLGYAGTIDWLGTYKNKTFLFDFKTSSSMHETMKLQLSAYRKLLKEERDITIDGAAIVFISKKGVTLQEVSLDELDKVYKKFEVMLQLFELYRDDLIIEPDDLIQCDLTNP